MPINFKVWPPAPYKSQSWPDNWLRFETEYPDSKRPSRLVAHASVPYVAHATGEQPVADILGQIASDYLTKLEAYLTARSKSLDILSHWGPTLDFSTAPDGQFGWLDVWPEVDSDPALPPPHLASWNLSRHLQNSLPATIIMVATDVLNAGQDIGGNIFGIRVPMLVEEQGNKLKVTIRSMTAEYPTSGFHTWLSPAVEQRFVEKDQHKRALVQVINHLTNSDSYLRSQIAEAASVDRSSIRVEDILVVAQNDALTETDELTLKTVSKARGALERFPNPLSYQVINTMKFTISDAPETNPELLGTETCALATSVGQGEARIFPQAPPASTKPVDPAHPNADYDWSMHRPTRIDDVLDKFRETFSFGGLDVTLKKAGFDVRLCPDYVPQDRSTAQAGDTKIVHLPADKKIPPRRNELSALSAYYNSDEFFELLGHFGIDPATFVVRAQTDIEIYYRYGITPGPGKDGKTVNAQVAFDCKADGATRPPIRMNLALAELSRWDRPLTPSGRGTFAQPLGIAMDKRWMLHEFGHYLLAARIGKLEFDFAHSAGDAMAAIACDPMSRLADTRAGVAESFRGVTYPFVFSTRRHDRSPLLGWAWYGALNRSVIASPPVGCETTKGYLTEQILSSTLFRLYRSLGGDTMSGPAPDLCVRQRASFVTLFLLVRAIAGFAQSPSKAEMLELGMEDASLLLGGALTIPETTVPHPDAWSGGMCHKVVRWAFEAQGMFPEHETQPLNGSGQAPLVDIYVQDRRPLQEVINQNRFSYGPGSYCPVSLDWTDSALWMCSTEIVFGNRGSLSAVDCSLRVWLGTLDSDPTLDCGLNANVTWKKVLSTGLPDIEPGAQTQPFANGAVQDAINDAEAQGATRIVVLYELTSPADRANTDKDADLAVRVKNTNDLPRTARALTDLVANDNNLGLRLLTP